MSNKAMNRFIYRAYLRDGSNEHTGEALLLAMLLHTQASDRKSDAMVDVQRIMRDINLDQSKKTPQKKRGTKTGSR